MGRGAEARGQTGAQDGCDLPVNHGQRGIRSLVVPTRGWFVNLYGGGREGPRSRAGRLGPERRHAFFAETRTFFLGHH